MKKYIQNLFTQHKWSEWKSLGFFESYVTNRPYELFYKKCELTGLKKYKSVRVPITAHGITIDLNKIFNI